MYVIIDWHARDLHEAEAVAFFGEMAKRYGEHPHVLYEIFNEPEKDETWPQGKAYAKAVIGTIRQYDPDNLMIVEERTTIKSGRFGSTSWKRTKSAGSTIPCPTRREDHLRPGTGRQCLRQVERW